VSAPARIKEVKPDYPAAALYAKVQGDVVLEVTIDAKGAVTKTRVVQSIPLLDGAAEDAVKQWRFAPTVVNGKAVNVTMPLTVKFSLGNAASAANASGAVDDAGWLSSEQYQAAFESRRKQRFYPARVEGRNNSGRSEFRADWQEVTPRCQFRSHHGLTGEAFEQASNRYKADGYSLTASTQFVDMAGIRRFQATWKSCAN